MGELVKKFIVKISLITFFMGVISASVFYFFPERYFSSFPFVLLTFPIISVIVYMQLIKTAKKSLSSFNIAFMISFMIKLFVYIGLAAAIISQESQNKISFVISFMLLYVVFTVFDTKSILEDMKFLEKGKE